jgi:K(+)-stimulated pyrophosphate-energized sodium pump
MRITSVGRFAAIAAALAAFSSPAIASESQINIPDLRAVSFDVAGQVISGMSVLYSGIAICGLGLAFGLWQYLHTRRLPVHPAMAAVSDTIWETCKT